MMVTTTKGQFTDVEGAITLDETNWANSSVDVEIDAASITTRDAQRDAHLKSPDFLDVATFPKLTFTSTKVEHTRADRLTIAGDLTIRGVTRPVVLDTVHYGQAVTPFGGQDRRLQRRDELQPGRLRPDVERRVGDGRRPGQRLGQDQHRDRGRQAGLTAPTAWVALRPAAHDRGRPVVDSLIVWRPKDEAVRAPACQ